MVQITNSASATSILHISTPKASVIRKLFPIPKTRSSQLQLKIPQLAISMSLFVSLDQRLVLLPMISNCYRWFAFSLCPCSLSGSLRPPWPRLVQGLPRLARSLGDNFGRCYRSTSTLPSGTPPLTPQPTHVEEEGGAARELMSLILFPFPSLQRLGGLCRSNELYSRRCNSL